MVTFTAGSGAAAAALASCCCCKPGRGLLSSSRSAAARLVQPADLAPALAASWGASASTRSRLSSDATSSASSAPCSRSISAEFLSPRHVTRRVSCGACQLTFLEPNPPPVLSCGHGGPRARLRVPPGDIVRADEVARAPRAARHHPAVARRAQVVQQRRDCVGWQRGGHRPRRRPQLPAVGAQCCRAAAAQGASDRRRHLRL
mmetsp:Transcript_39187/g.123523  ORF Transcript_39187/g.123523 Transcript_39187/m.123523 type:complete len:203 (-) Transcript_39187:1507-2115(-)